MSLINILPPHVADLIAAGEVIERPASVIKELTENSIDAGAENVTIEIRDAGLTYIRVTDDGDGMSPEDAGIAFIRHATGKLRDERGLEAIGTLGFRGEALAAVSACSKIELITRARGAADGCRVALEAGEIAEMAPCGSPSGTIMTVRDLFYNTPARLKFIKSERAEAMACVTSALRCALGRPEISMRFIKDGKDEFFSPGGDARSCVYGLLGREFANSLLPCRTERDGVSVTGFVSSPASCRGSRDRQYFFCNGRWIRSALLQAALEQAYRNCLPKGRFPSCALYIEISPGAVDVNVHPTKAEVRFSNERKVFDGVYFAALAAVESEPPGAVAAFRPPPVTVFSPSPGSGPPARPPEYAGRARDPGKEGGAALFEKAEPETPFFRETEARIGESVCEYGALREATGSAAEPEQPDPAPRQLRFAPELSGVAVIGEAFDSYIVAQSSDSLIFADKHAVHERIIFDRLKTERRNIPAQSLISPRVVRTDAFKAELAEKHGEFLRELGFEVEPFGEKDIIVRALPCGTDESDAQALIEEILEGFETAGAARGGAEDELLRAAACSAAVKAGSPSSEEELAELIGRVMSGEVKYCPHGRPLCFSLSKRELDKKFKRVP